MQKALLSVIQTIAEQAVYSFELVLKYGISPPRTVLINCL